MKAFIAILLSFALYSCSDNQSMLPLVPMQEIKGRDYDGERFNIYRMRVPITWIRKDSLPDESLADTKKSICEFLITNGNDIIRIAIHNFPSESLEQRIPPAAQVARWQRQFEILQPEESHTIPQAFSGYSGLKFKGVGLLNQTDTMVIGWSLQLDNEHYRTLSHPKLAADKNRHREMQADVTIKAVGPKEFMEIHEDEINKAARSFELIEEIPTCL